MLMCDVELKGAVGQIIQGDRHTVFTVEQNKALVPPSYSRYLAWGFPDMSVRIGYYDSDKVLVLLVVSVSVLDCCRRWEINPLVRCLHCFVDKHMQLLSVLCLLLIYCFISSRGCVV